MKVRIERLETMRAAHTHSSSNTPEEDAAKKILEWAGRKGLLEKSFEARLFGRNTYPTDKPEPHGYEFFLTVGPDVEAEDDVDIGEIPGGLYAVLRFKDLGKIGEAWRHLFDWIKENRHRETGFKKGKYGWVNNGFEEHLNWRENRPQNEWAFDLWVQLEESPP